MIDKTPHPSVQPWSRGELFPAVIARVEVQIFGIYNIWATYWDLIYPGREDERFEFPAAAEARARELNAKAANDRAAAKCFADAVKYGQGWMRTEAPVSKAKVEDVARIIAAYNHGRDNPLLGMLPGAPSAGIKQPAHWSAAGFSTPGYFEACDRSPKQETLASTYPELNQMVREACREEIAKAKRDDTLVVLKKRREMYERWIVQYRARGEYHRARYYQNRLERVLNNIGSL